MVSSKKSISLILFCLTLISCSQKVSNIYVDDFFAVLYEVEEDEANIYTLKNFGVVDLPEGEVLVSPLLYNSRKEYFSNFNNKVVVTGEVKDIFHENHHMLEFSTLNIYEELVGVLSSEDYTDNIKTISVIIDDFDDLDKKEIEVLKQLDEIFDYKILKVRKGVTKSSVKRFVERNKSSELWLIDCAKYSLYAYDTIDDGKVIIRHGHILQRTDEDIIFSIERDFSAIFEKNGENDEYLIEEYLKKY